jgi:oxygen-independent coproporphyrinogen III oxidase
MKTGLYIHIPFCIRKCGYCDFYSVTDFTLEDRFVEAAIKEIKIRAGEKLAIDTVYFGGGTPSVIGAPRIAAIMGVVRNAFQLAPQSEITIEVNPGTVKGTFLEDVKVAGINRVSIGIQSFDDKDLTLLGRIHTAAEARDCVEEVKELFRNYSVDLIHGIPGQDMQKYAEGLHAMAQAGVPHISAYGLTSEEGTPLAAAVIKGKITMPDEDIAAAFLETTIAALTSEQYLHYEISSFARKASFISRHNAKYWDFTPYIGIGPSAHSFDGHERAWNTTSLALYCDKLGQNILPVESEEVVSPQERFHEKIMLGLRRFDTGIKESDIREGCAGTDFAERQAALDNFLKQGYLQRKSDHILLTERGALVYNLIVKELIV